MKNVTKSFDYHQPDMSVNRSVYASCLSLDSVIGQLKGQLTRRDCVRTRCDCVRTRYVRALFSYFIFVG